MTQKDIVQKASFLFQQYGIKSVTMDAIAQELGISKKTLYHYFANKKDLVLNSITINIARLKSGMNKIRRTEQEPIVCLAKMLYLIFLEHSRYNNVYFQNLQKLPEPQKRIQEFKQQVKEQHLIPLLQTAVQQKSIRPSVDLNLVCQILFLLIDNYLLEKLNKGPAASFQKMYEHLVLINLKGCLTPEKEYLLNSCLRPHVWNEIY